MRKLLTILFLLSVTLRAAAVPACPDPFVATNADGSKVTIVLHGDEFYNYTTTSDGYTVLRNSAGSYEYARLSGGKIVGSGIVAHDASSRKGAEQSFLSATPKGLVDAAMASGAKRAKALRDDKLKLPPRKAGSGNGFRGLVVLVNYSDKKLHRTDAQDFYARMTNERNYTGYTSDIPLFNKYGTYTGSVRDYFYDNSMGQFDPQFDVIGPIDMDDYSCEDGRERSAYMFLDIVNNIYDDYGINLWDYDNDGDGCVDLVFFIVAGFGSNYSGNDPSYLWPHASYFIESTTGEPIIRFACSTEYYGREENDQYIPDGIGVICHEFSHCLGVYDLYDTDYGESGGQSLHPGRWDIMASGAYLNFSRTPAGYSLYDRYAMGFANPTVISSGGAYTLNPLGDTNQGFIIETPNTSEKFLLENRQQTSKWDAALPGHGLIVCRMDSTSSEPWISNKVNANPSHTYYELLRAGGDGSATANSDSDPFPGTSNVTTIAGDSSTTPNLLTWDQKENDLNILDISENNGDITFTVQAPVRIDEINFPDQYFRAWVSSNYNNGKYENGYYYLDQSRAEEVTEININNVDNGSKATSLKGIEYFKGLEYLAWSSGALTELDLSQNTELVDLYCNVNALTSLKLDGCTKLKTLWCGFNQLTALDLSHNTELNSLNCNNDPLLSINLSNTKLTSFSFSSGNYKSLAPYKATVDGETVYYFYLNDAAKGDHQSLSDMVHAIQGGDYFDIAKVTSWTGGATAEGDLLRINNNATILNYKYDTGNSKLLAPTLNAGIDFANAILDPNPPFTSAIYGDVNGDGEVTVGDVSAIYNIILGLSEEYKDAADVNGDGEVTVGDVSAIYDIILGTHA